MIMDDNNLNPIFVSIRTKDNVLFSGNVIRQPEIINNVLVIEQKTIEENKDNEYFVITQREIIPISSPISIHTRSKTIKRDDLQQN